MCNVLIVLLMVSAINESADCCSLGIVSLRLFLSYTGLLTTAILH